MKGDVLRPETLAPALEGVDTVVYLVHSMSSSRLFDEADREAARAFGAAALEAGVRKVVYLGWAGARAGLAAVEVEPCDGESSHVTQTAIFEPVGLFGLVRWYCLWPFHHFIFGGMLRNLTLAMDSGDARREPR